MLCHEAFLMCTHFNIVQIYLDKQLKDTSLSYNPTTQQSPTKSLLYIKKQQASITGMSFGIIAASLLYNRG